MYYTFSFVEHVSCIYIPFIYHVKRDENQTKTSSAISTFHRLDYLSVYGTIQILRNQEWWVGGIGQMIEQ